MKSKTLFVYLFLPFVLNCQIISKVELKFNGYYSFVKHNYQYAVNEYNTLYAYQLQTNGNLTDTGFSYKPIYGIVDPHNYLTYEPEIILRKFLFKERLDIGFKYGIKRTKIKHDFAINPLRARITAIVPMKVDQTIYYSSLGLQIAYYMPKIKSRIEMGIENSMPHKRIESSTRSITTDFRFYAFTVLIIIILLRLTYLLVLIINLVVVVMLRTNLIYKNLLIRKLNLHMKDIIQMDYDYLV